MIWRLQTSPSVTLVNESASPALPQSVQDPGFFTSVSSNRTSNAVVWAVGRPVDSNPADVILYAFDPQAAAGGNNAWLFSGVAGTWPNVGSDTDIVPVVADGRVYVASYKELAIFGLPPAAPPSLRVPCRPLGRRRWRCRPMVTRSLRRSKPWPVTTSRSPPEPENSFTSMPPVAIKVKQTVVLLVDEPVRLLGSFDGAGILKATSITHAKPSPKGWPADR